MMNTGDVEKTQVWVKNLMNASEAKAASPIKDMPLPTTIPKSVPRQLPKLKKLSKEEKIILATGGALAVGLAAIVITSFNDNPEEILAEKVDDRDLTAPVLDFGNTEEMPLEKISETESPALKAAPPRREAAPYKAPHHEPAPPVHTEKGPHHALLEIPEHPEVATSVDDKSTFIEAFNTARAEIGPAGLFAWRGTYYSTFTDREWENVAEDKKEMWLRGADPIIDPHTDHEAPAEAANFEHVIVADRGAVVWTGIDKNEDGIAEVLMGRVKGQSPMVLMDSDHDGKLDMRYDFDAVSGKTFASPVTPFSMTGKEIEQMEYVELEPDMGFFNNSDSKGISEGIAVSIHISEDEYVVSIDSDGNNVVDAISHLSDRHRPVVGLDMDNDGQIEMGFVYNEQSHQMDEHRADEVLEEISFVGPLDFDEAAHQAEEPHDHPGHHDINFTDDESDNESDDPDFNDDQILL